MDDDGVGFGCTDGVRIGLAAGVGVGCTDGVGIGLGRIRLG